MCYCAEGFASADATRGQWKQTNVCGRPLDPFAVASHVTWFLSLQGRQKGKQYYTFGDAAAAASSATYTDAPSMLTFSSSSVRNKYSA